MYLGNQHIPKAKSGKFFLRIILLLILTAAFAPTLVSGQVQYPADSLLSSKEVPLLRKIGILPIAGWQRLSYNSHSLDCQYAPACSFYAAQAIGEHGLILFYGLRSNYPLQSDGS
ncbi:MAG: membrane protein insertion efficiency factor YidD [Planctomycetota bacterium]